MQTRFNTTDESQPAQVSGGGIVADERRRAVFPLPLEPDGTTLKVWPRRATHYHLLDASNYKLYVSRPWSENADGYLCAYVTKGVKILFHRAVARAPHDALVDHVNRRRWDHRARNLRLATRSENAANRTHPHRITTSQYRGVHRKRDGRFVAAAKHRIGGKQVYYYGGVHRDEMDAARAYNTIAVGLWGDFAILNHFPDAMRRAG